MNAAIYLNSKSTAAPVREYDAVICADGGVKYCPVAPDYFVGDCDSSDAVPQGAECTILKPKKNDTDGEACVVLAHELGVTELDFYGVLGGRCDHVLGNFCAMSLAKKLGMLTAAHEDGVTLYLRSGRVTLPSRKGAIVSVIPHGGEAVVADYDGLEYPLVDLTLSPSSTIGISNVAQKDSFTLDIVKGEVLIFVYA